MNSRANPTMGQAMQWMYRQVPRQLRLVRFGPVSQVDIQASPICAESRDDPAGIARECQAVANAHGLPVRFSCELRSGEVSRHAFYPETKP